MLLSLPSMLVGLYQSKRPDSSRPYLYQSGLYLSAATLIEEVAKEVSFLSVSASSSKVV